MLSIAEEWLLSISFILIMMKELVTQTASDTLGTDERNAIKSEIDELSSEVGDIVSETQFNGIALVNGTYTGISFQTGEGTSVYALICDYSESHGAASLSVASGDVSNNITNAASAASALTNVNGAIDVVECYTAKRPRILYLKAVTELR